VFGMAEFKPAAIHYPVDLPAMWTGDRPEAATTPPDA
jgi:hypothetical protein